MHVYIYTYMCIHIYKKHIVHCISCKRQPWICLAVSSYYSRTSEQKSVRTWIQKQHKCIHFYFKIQDGKSKKTLISCLLEGTDYQRSWDTAWVDCIKWSKRNKYHVRWTNLTQAKQASRNTWEIMNTRQKNIKSKGTHLRYHEYILQIQIYFTDESIHENLKSLFVEKKSKKESIFVFSKETIIWYECSLFHTILLHVNLLLWNM